MEGAQRGEALEPVQDGFLAGSRQAENRAASVIAVLKSSCSSFHSRAVQRSVCIDCDSDRVGSIRASLEFIQSAFLARWTYLINRPAGTTRAHSRAVPRSAINVAHFVLHNRGSRSQLALIIKCVEDFVSLSPGGKG